MKHFVLVLSFSLVLFASCERTEIEHGFADKVESVFFNPDTASSQFVCCVMKNGDSLSFYGEKDSKGMPLSITYLHYYSSEKQMGTLMTFNDGKPLQVIADDGSSVLFEWITDRRANVKVSDPINHSFLCGILDLDSDYSVNPQFWDTVVTKKTSDSRHVRNMNLSENIHTNGINIEPQVDYDGQIVHVDFTRCGQYADVISYMKVFDGYTRKMVDIVRPTKVGNGYNYYVEAHIPSVYEVDSETAIQIGRILDALLNGIWDEGNLGLIINSLSFMTAVYTGGFSALLWSIAQSLLTDLAALIHEIYGKYIFEELARDYVQHYLANHTNCYVQVFADGEEFPQFPLVYEQASFFREYELPSEPEIEMDFSRFSGEVNVSCIPPGSLVLSRFRTRGITVDGEIYEETVSDERVFPSSESSEYYSGWLESFYGGDEYFYWLWWIVAITCPDGTVLMAIGS